MNVARTSAETPEVISMAQTVISTSRRPFEKADNWTFSGFNSVIGVLVVLTAYCCMEEVQCCDNEVFNLI